MSVTAVPNQIIFTLYTGTIYKYLYRTLMSVYNNNIFIGFSRQSSYRSIIFGILCVFYRITSVTIFFGAFDHVWLEVLISCTSTRYNEIFRLILLKNCSTGSKCYLRYSHFGKKGFQRSVGSDVRILEQYLHSATLGQSSIEWTTS
jgi:hypothetical protein